MSRHSCQPSEYPVKTVCRRSGLAAERQPPPEPALRCPPRRPAAVHPKLSHIAEGADHRTPGHGGYPASVSFHGHRAASPDPEPTLTVLNSQPPSSRSSRCHLRLTSPVPRPAQPHWVVMRADRLALGGRRSLGGRLGCLRHHQRTQIGVGYENAVKADQVQPGARHQRGQALHELQRRHPLVRGAFAPGRLQLGHHLAHDVGLHIS